MKIDKQIRITVEVIEEDDDYHQAIQDVLEDRMDQIIDDIGEMDGVLMVEGYVP